ncbi:MAG TPA: iron-sulfur cluster repair di-iron protein [Terriglobia bacterium]|nr:iron-sulfur cluster repair di-iron protein [Terriglobia bacterium]
MEIDASKTVKEIAAGIPSSLSVFEALGIDYCCGGEKRLDEACRAAGLQVETVVQTLDAAAGAAQAGEETVDWKARSLASLMDHIVEKHHAFCRAEVSRIGPLVEKVVQAHGAAHPELRRIKSLFSELCQELLMHLTKEEQTLFPYISRMEALVTQGLSFPRPAFGTVQNPVRMMIMEHDHAGAALQEMRSLSTNYQLPPDACNSYRALYDGLKSFERDMHQHVHLENNILFPRAVTMEDAAVAGEHAVPHQAAR